ncbi:Rab1a [Hexamita inflata]|uniref:Rab1a n=1 Tax=Hexamita inflata TaxID=28002 RepID=A0AA86P935_9EUKA|nr:Rab1a [Hexamita inflata]
MRRQLKVLFLGDSGVGKSTLLSRYVNNKSSSCAPTFGVNFLQKDVSFQKQKFRLHFFDVSGAQMQIPAFNDISVFVFVYDLSSNQTLLDLNDWFKQFGTGPQNQCVLVGNKFDLNQNEVSGAEQTFGLCKHFKVCAKTGLGVDELFKHIIQLGMNTFGAEEQQQQYVDNDWETVGEESAFIMKEKKGCCEK